MSKTLYVDFRDQGFWAYDVVSNVLLKHMIDNAEVLAAEPGGAWLKEVIQHWRFNTATSDCGLYLDSEWSATEVETVIGIVQRACEVLGQREMFSEDEIESWVMYEDTPISTRGASFVKTAPVLNLGMAMISIMKGVLSPPPPGTAWYYWTNDSATTIEMTSYYKSWVLPAE